MKMIINKLIESKFFRAFLTISSASVIAQIINFVFQPIISRLYSVEQFGEYAIYTSVLSVASVVITLAYDQAVIAAKDNDEAQRLFFGTVYISGILSTLFGVFCCLFYDRVLMWMGLEKCDWLFILPINFFMLSFYNLIVSYNYRIGKYRSLGSAACIRTTVMGIMQVTLFYIGLSSIGLSLARVIALISCSIVIFKNCIKSGINKQNARITPIVGVLKANYQFPVFQLPASFVNHFLDMAITFAILSLFTSQELGIYSLVVQVLAMPINLVCTSLRQLCISEFSRIQDNVEESRKLFLKVTIGMSALIIFGMGILSIWGEPIFTFVFGAKWKGAGMYIRCLALLYSVRFVAYPLSSVAVVTKKQNVFLLFQVLLIVGSYVALGVAKAFDFSIYGYLFMLSALLSLVYILQSFVFYRILVYKKGNLKGELRND